MISIFIVTFIIFSILLLGFGLMIDIANNSIERDKKVIEYYNENKFHMFPDDVIKITGSDEVYNIDRILFLENMYSSWEDKVYIQKKENK